MSQLVQGLGGLFVFRLAAAVAAVMGCLGLVLAIVGVYGMVSYSVSQRTNEIGIRMALGAGSNDILKLVSTEGLRVVSFGVTAGMLAAWALSRGVKSLLVGVNAADPITFVTVGALLTLVALAACLVPAHRAMRVDPMIALRHE